MKKTYDDSNWREDYAKNFCNNKRHLELLENGPHSLSQAWLLGALHNEWKRIKGYKDCRDCRGRTQSRKRIKTCNVNGLVI